MPCGRKEATASGSALSEQIAAYRAGYLPKERREIEDALKRGLLTGVTSTNALEVGIDIGSLDCVIISGYPGTVLATWQQAGRSGRRNRDALAVLVGFQNPLDQYLMKHPESFFGKPHEQAIIDLENPYILSGHLLCTVAELPLDTRSEAVFPMAYSGELLPELAAEGLVKETPHGWVYTGRGRPVEAVGLDHIARDAYHITCDGVLLETMDAGQAYREAHLGAVLLHQGDTHVVRRFDLENHLVEVERKDVDYYTQAVKTVDLEILATRDTRRLGQMAVHLGELEVTEKTLGYKVMQNDQVIAREELELPPLSFRTAGLWFTIPGELRRAIYDGNFNFGGALHALEHAMIAILPLEVMCDRWDIGGLSTPGHPGTGEPTIFLYDGYEGGIGLTEKAQELMERVTRLTLELIRDCPCEARMPCLHPLAQVRERQPPHGQAGGAPAAGGDAGEDEGDSGRSGNRRQMENEKKMMMTIPAPIETIQKRVSCRTFDGRPIDGKTKEKLCEFLRSNTRGPFGNPLRFDLIDLTEAERGPN